MVITRRHTELYAYWCCLVIIPYFVSLLYALACRTRPKHWRYFMRSFMKSRDIKFRRANQSFGSSRWSCLNLSFYPRAWQALFWLCFLSMPIHVVSLSQIIAGLRLCCCSLACVSVVGLSTKALLLFSLVSHSEVLISLTDRQWWQIWTNSYVQLPARTCHWSSCWNNSSLSKWGVAGREFRCIYWCSSLTAGNGCRCNFLSQLEFKVTLEV